MDNNLLLARRLLVVSGADGLALLDKLVSQDLSDLGPERPVAYTLLLTPQGKYLYDFFVIWAEGGLYLDVPASQADGIVATLNKYKLRSDAAFAPRDDLNIQLTQTPVAGAVIAVPDPRSPVAAGGLGLRCWSANPGVVDSDYVQTLTRLGVVEPSIELQSGTAMPIEFGLQNQNAISFEKGCYMGQELTARMQHKGLAKHQLVVAKTMDDQALAGSFNADVFDTQGATIGTVIRIASPYALLHIVRDANGVIEQPVFELQRSDDSVKIQLARN